MKSSHGGKRAGAGRKKNGTIEIHLRVTPEQKDVIDLRGGSSFIRNLIEEKVSKMKEYLIKTTFNSSQQEVNDCYERLYEFKAEDDAEAIQIAKHLQEVADKKVRLLIKAAQDRSDALSLEIKKLEEKAKELESSEEDDEDLDLYDIRKDLRNLEKEFTRENHRISELEDGYMNAPDLMSDLYKVGDDGEEVKVE